MKVRTLMAAAALLGMPSVAMADGMPTRGSYCCESVTWSGLYIGMHTGGAWDGNTAWTFPGTTGQFSTSSDGPIIGGQLGFNHQIGVLVLGAELSLAASRIEGTRTAAVSGFPVTSATDHFRTDVNDLFTATGRVGLALDKVLLYGKGGYASAGVEMGAHSGVSGDAVTDHQNRDGWIAGAGLEYRLMRGLVFGLEYNYVDLSGGHFASTTVNGNPFNVNFGDVHFQSVTARLSILLDRSPTASPIK